jgi:hypothetical protein
MIDCSKQCVLLTAPAMSFGRCAGYGGELTPNPNCWPINCLITFQTICSLMLDYTMLGLVYARCAATCSSLMYCARCAVQLLSWQFCSVNSHFRRIRCVKCNQVCRFSSPVLRAWSIRFSKNLFMHVMNDKLMLSLRIGNVRSKTFLNPSARLLLAMEVDDQQQSGHPEDGKPLCLVVRQPTRMHTVLGAAEACTRLV